MNDADLLHELEPHAAAFLERHLASAKEWFPHELVPWSRGRDFEAGEAWDPHEYELSDGVRSSLFVNMLTEDNLPHYFHTIKTKFGRLDAWAEWSHRWTAEEGRHLIVLRDYLTVTRAVDPVALERARIAQVTKGEVPDPDTVMESIIYVAVQELATRVAHRNTGKMLVDPAGEAIMKRVAMDENLHHIFYRDLSREAAQLDPSAFVIALDRQITDFAMPGTGIIGFKQHAAAIARAGIYDFALHYENVVAPVVFTHFDVENMSGLSSEAENARDHLLKFISRLKRYADRSKERAQRADAGASA